MLSPRSRGCPSEKSRFPCATATGSEHERRTTPQTGVEHGQVVHDVDREHPRRARRAARVDHLCTVALRGADHAGHDVIVRDDVPLAVHEEARSDRRLGGGAALQYLNLDHAVGEAAEDVRRRRREAGLLRAESGRQEQADEHDRRRAARVAGTVRHQRGYIVAGPAIGEARDNLSSRGGRRQPRPSACQTPRRGA